MKSASFSKAKEKALTIKTELKTYKNTAVFLSTAVFDFAVNYVLV